MIKMTKMLFKHKSFVYFSTKKTLSLSFEFFISKRILKNKVEGNKVSRPIVRISILSIALAVVVNLITLAVVTGFQHEVRQKVSGFGSHAFIMNAGEGSVYECEPIYKNQSFYPNLEKMEGVSHLQYVGYKPVLFQSDRKTIRYTLANGKDTVQIQQEIQGAIIKGVGNGFDWTFFKEHLVKGKVPVFRDPEISNEILISSQIANDLNITVGDQVRAFFVKSQPVKRMFLVCGIYETGLAELDNKMVIGDLKIVQQLNDWGITASIMVEDTLANGHLIIRKNVTGGNGNYRFDWGDGYCRTEGYTILPRKDTVYRLIVSDYWTNIDGKNEKNTIPDTAYLSIKVIGDTEHFCKFSTDEHQEIKKKYLDEAGTKFSVTCGERTILFEQINGKGSHQNYVSGFEVAVDNWEKLGEVVQQLKREVGILPTSQQEELRVSSIIENQNDLFVWLGFLDLNVYIILILMIVIGIINMGSALLVLILMRTNFIGMMKAMGATNWSIRKIFLYQGAFLIGKGMVWGNIIGVGFCLLQQQFGFLQLNPEVYYLTKVPIELNFWAWLFLNIGTLLTCVLALILPSYVITRVDPVKSIKFN
jgi:lipoprotein-releasing system permease protein